MHHEGHQAEPREGPVGLESSCFQLKKLIVERNSRPRSRLIPLLDLKDLALLLAEEVHSVDDGVI